MNITRIFTAAVFALLTLAASPAFAQQGQPFPPAPTTTNPDSGGASYWTPERMRNAKPVEMYLNKDPVTPPPSPNPPGSEQPGALPPAKTILPVEIKPSERNVPAKNTRLSPPLPPAVQQTPQKLPSGITGPSAIPGGNNPPPETAGGSPPVSAW